MYPTKIPSEWAEEEKAKWRVVKLDSFSEPCPGLVWFADCETGAVTIQKPPKPEVPTEHVEFQFPAYSFRILPQLHRSL